MQINQFFFKKKLKAQKTINQRSKKNNENQSLLIK